MDPRYSGRGTIATRAEIESILPGQGPVLGLFPRLDQLSPRGLLRSVREIHLIMTMGFTAKNCAVLWDSLSHY